MSADKVTAVDITRALALKHYKDFFLTEVKSGSTWFTPKGDMKRLDGLAIRKSWTNPCFTGYEVKISRGDFLRDAKFYTYEELCNCLYIVCPKGMIQREELPESVGLMYYDPTRGTIITKKKAIYREITYSPDMLLYIIYSRLDSDRYPFFSDRQEYFSAYLQNRIDNRELGFRVKSKLIEENVRLEQKVSELKHFETKYEEYRKIKNVLQKHRIYGFFGDGCAEELDKILSRSVPVDIDVIRRDLERIVSRLQKLEGSNNGEENTDPAGV